MSEGTKIIVAIPPEFFRESQSTLPKTFEAAHMIYRVGRGFKLFRSKNVQTRGGFMVLDISGFKGGGPMSALIYEVISECKSAQYGGIVIDSGETPGQFAALSKALAAAARESGLLYFVPESLADSEHDSIVRITTALSGGTLTRHLSDAVRKYGAKRVAAEIERVRMDFKLPAHSGVGKGLTGGELDSLLVHNGTNALFSPELAVKYFNYRDRKNAHFVLYDDESTIRRKLALTESLGIEYAFLYYPSVRDVLTKLG